MIRAKDLAKYITGIIGGLFVFVVVLGFLLFFANHLVEGLPGRYPLAGYSFCLITAFAAGWSSFRSSLRVGNKRSRDDD